MFDRDFFKNRKIFITGHTGFKGSWMTRLLLLLGSQVTGYSLPPEKDSLFSMLGLGREAEDKEACIVPGPTEASAAAKLKNIYADIRDIESLKNAILSAEPEIVIHMAAQPLVRRSYEEPVLTYETNVLGTVNLLEALRSSHSVRSLINVTTDKVYLNREIPWGYRETDELNGFDPYSNSKSCSELVTMCYRNSYFKDSGPAITTVRAGNVIGGGDFAENRIIPDCVRAFSSGQAVYIRDPYSVRPYQHVLEPVCAYLLLSRLTFNDRKLAGSYNIGPDERSFLHTGDLAELFRDKWRALGGNAEVEFGEPNGPHEAGILKLDSTLIKERTGWRPVWDAVKAIEKTAEWYNDEKDPVSRTDAQILEYLNDLTKFWQ